MNEKDKEAEEESRLCQTHGLTNSKPKRKPKWKPNWKQTVVFEVAVLIYAGLYNHFISKYSVTIRIAIAAAFGCFAIFISSIFRDRKQAKEYIPERKKSSSDDSKREVNNKQIETLRVNP
ncbi:MAG: hypothetical protein AMJ53_08900 [Gammaproteobacteria bacterium SG8_11]|nr:MAG: hypothetical protein AMJ53_08900 [Gammaproteobacteria bacterium SG8_11]